MRVDGSQLQPLKSALAPDTGAMRTKGLRRLGEQLRGCNVSEMVAKESFKKEGAISGVIYWI